MITENFYLKKKEQYHTKNMRVVCEQGNSATLIWDTEKEKDRQVRLGVQVIIHKYLNFCLYSSDYWIGKQSSLTKPLHEKLMLQVK